MTNLLNISRTFVFALLVNASFASADETDDKDTKTAPTEIPVKEDQSTLDIIDVWAEPFSQKMGTQKLDSWTIDLRPKTNGTVSELLKSNPNVQFSNSATTSESMGEIAPENVSFHGERFYNNSWMIDGISNNDNIHPGSRNGHQNQFPDGYSAISLPAGGTQSFWINSDIIDSIDVYDSNISAKYGQFTGGVIDAKLKDADTQSASGSISYRTTRDSWTKFQLDGDDREDFESAEQLYYQPRFTKHNYSLNINQPINEKAAILFSYNRADSKFPYVHPRIRDEKNQRRISETFMLKGIYEADGGDTFKLTAMYSPHKSKYFKRDAKNGGFTNEGGGYRVNGEWEHLFNRGSVKTYLGWRKTGNDIEHEADNWFVWLQSDTFDWTSTSRNAHIGGFGNYRTEKEIFTLKQDYELDPFTLGSTTHKFSLGWKADWAKGKYIRGSETNLYSYRGRNRINAATVCNVGDPACVTGEQFLNQRLIFPALNASASNDHIAGYIEDQIRIGRLELTPGIRVSKDEFLDNTNKSPRLTASFDIFGNNNSTIFGGVNRYYADSLITNALRDKIGANELYRRTSSTADWVLNRTTTGRRYGNGDLKTPYSDEINLGFQQKFWNTEWTIKWVNRKAKDQFARTYLTDPDTRERWYYLNNNGKSEADTYTLTARLIAPVELSFTRITWDFGASHSRTKSNFNYYEDTTNEETDADKVIINDKLIEFGELPALDYNTPWNAFTNIIFEFPKWNLNWSNHLRYTAGYTAYSRSTIDCPIDNSACGSFSGRARLYEKQTFKNRFTLDWRFDYNISIFKDNLNLSLDVLNVLNSKIETSNSRGTLGSVSYKPGRQFWLGAKYTW